MVSEKIIGAMERSAAAYQAVQPSLPPGQQWRVDSKKTGLQCFVRKRGPTLYISFRGSDSKQDWANNLMFWKKTLPYGNEDSAIKVHAGFIQAYKEECVRDFLHSLVQGDVGRLSISGHSLGAAMAVLCAVDMQYNFPAQDIEVFLFGCPRVGNKAFAQSYNKRVFKTLRVENGNDIVTKLPPALFGYRHVGAKLHIGHPRLPLALSFLAHYPHKYYQHLLCRLLPKLPVG